MGTKDQQREKELKNAFRGFFTEAMLPLLNMSERELMGMSGYDCPLEDVLKQEEQELLGMEFLSPESFKTMYYKVLTPFVLLAEHTWRNLRHWGSKELEAYRSFGYPIMCEQLEKTNKMWLRVAKAKGIHLEVWPSFPEKEDDFGSYVRQHHL